MDVNIKQEKSFTDNETQIAEIARLLSHPARVRIINLLLEHTAMTSSEIASEIPLARTTVLQHINALKDGHWLKTSSDGSGIQYQIDTEAFKGISRDMGSFFQESSKRLRESEDPTRILFLCTGNSCRSQMAEGFINAYGHEYHVEAFSAGTSPAEEVQPMAVAVMAEKQIDISDHYPKPAKDFVGDRSIDLVIIVCEHAERECPYLFPFSKHKILMPFKDPKTPEEFREVRDQIETRLTLLLEELAGN